MPKLDYQTLAIDWLAELRHGTVRALCEDWYHGADPYTPSYTRAIQGHCAEPSKSTPSTSFAHSIWVCHVDYSSNNYSIEVDGLLEGGRGLHTGRHACYFTPLHPFDMKYQGPDENSDVPQLVSYFQKPSSRFSIRVGR